MRSTVWAAVVVLGGWLAAMAGYTLIGAAVAATLPEPEWNGTGGSDIISTADVLSALAVLMVVAAVAWLAAAVAASRAGLAPRAAAAVGATGPLAGVATTLLLFIEGGGTPWAALGHAAAAVLGAGLGLYLRAASAKGSGAPGRL